MKATAAPILMPYAAGTDPADAEAMTKAIAERVHALLLDLDPAWVRAVAGDAGKLLVVQGTGDPAFKALTGDVTVTEAGATTIGNTKVGTAKLALLAVTEAILGGEAVSTGKVKNLAITAEKLAAEAVEEAKIKALAISEGKLGNLAVGTGKIANLAVTAEKLANLAVETGKIANLAITTEKLANEAVTNAKIANGTVKDEKLEKPLITGLVSAAGAKELGSGFTCEKLSTGLYKIILEVEPVSVMVGGATQDNTEGLRIPQFVERAGKNYQLKWRDAANAVQDTRFSFWLKRP